MSLPLPATLSPSKVSTFRSCALSFRFSAIERIPEAPSASTAKGTLVHRALELLFWEVPAGERSLPIALDLLERAWEDVMYGAEYAPLTETLTISDAATMREDAVQLVRNYFTLEDPNAVQAIGTELRLDAPVHGARLRGVIDRLDLDADGELVVTDYKTGKAPPERFEGRHLSGVSFYAFLCEHVLGRRPARVQLLHLREPVAIISQPSDQSIRMMQRQAAAVWAAVERACQQEDFRPNPGPLCAFCSFKAYCPAFGGDPALAATSMSGATGTSAA